MPELQLGKQFVNDGSCTDPLESISQIVSVIESQGWPGPVTDPDGPTYTSVYVTQVDGDYIFVIVGNPEGDPDGNGELDPEPGSGTIIIPIGGGVFAPKPGNEIDIQEEYISFLSETKLAMVRTTSAGIDAAEVQSGQDDDNLDRDLFPGDSIITPGYADRVATNTRITEGALLLDDDGLVLGEDDPNFVPADPPLIPTPQRIKVTPVINASDKKFTSEDGELVAGQVWRTPKLNDFTGEREFDEDGKPLWEEAFVLPPAIEGSAISRGKLINSILPADDINTPGTTPLAVQVVKWNSAGDGFIDDDEHGLLTGVNESFTGKRGSPSEPVRVFGYIETVNDVKLFVIADFDVIRGNPDYVLGSDPGASDDDPDLQILHHRGADPRAKLDSGPCGGT